MMRNEKIAEKMGWRVEPNQSGDGELCLWDKNNNYICGMADISDIWDIEIAHLLIERMVVDGWRITIINWPPIAGQKPFKKFTLYAEKFTNERSFVDFKSEDNYFPAAVVELFCRVYAIPDGE